jgi:chromosome segregation ATPase
MFAIIPVPFKPEALKQTMDTASRKSSGGRSTDRVFEALATIAALLDRTLSEMKSIDSEFQERLLQAVHDTEASLQSQTAQHIEGASSQWEAERKRLNNALEKTAQMGADWEAERGRLSAEIERLQNALAVAQAHKEIEKNTEPPVNSAALSKEIERVENLIKEISSVIDDPSTPLSIVIRKNVERAELESYLKGIRYAFEPR